MALRLGTELQVAAGPLDGHPGLLDGLLGQGPWGSGAQPDHMAPGTPHQPQHVAPKLDLFDQ